MTTNRQNHHKNKGYESGYPNIYNHILPCALIHTPVKKGVYFLELKIAKSWQRSNLSTHNKHILWHTFCKLPPPHSYARIYLFGNCNKIVDITVVIDTSVLSLIYCVIHKPYLRPGFVQICLFSSTLPWWTHVIYFPVFFRVTSSALGNITSTLMVIECTVYQAVINIFDLGPFSVSCLE